MHNISSLLTSLPSGRSVSQCLKGKKSIKERGGLKKCTDFFTLLGLSELLYIIPAPSKKQKAQKAAK